MFYNFSSRRAGGRFGPIDANEYVNVLPEDSRLAEVTSNFWGTKFQLISHNLDVLPPTLGEVIYKASLLHLQPRQMRLEMIDLKDDVSTDPFGNLFGDEDLGNESEEEDENFVVSGDDAKGVTMKDNILRAVTDEVSTEDEQEEEEVDEVDRAKVAAQGQTNVAPIAPLPTRLSFCLPPPSMTRSAPNAGAANLCTPNESSIIEALRESDSTPLKKQSPLRKSPVKTVASQAIAKAEGIIVADPMTQSLTTSSGGLTPESPSKRRLRMSVSCDNYLSEAKLSLSRRDSVGSGSPHSSRGSPRRWAAKVDEIEAAASGTADTTLATIEQPGGGACQAVQVENPSILQQPHQPPRSCSVNELDVIVDLLGVPSELLTQRDLNKRLVLLKEKDESAERDSQIVTATERPKAAIKGKYPSLERCGKSRSCDDDGAVASSSPGKANLSVQRRRKRDQAIEIKRKSVYSKDCKGRSEEKSCLNCETVAREINDADLNKEIFDVPLRKDLADEEDWDPPEPRVIPPPTSIEEDAINNSKTPEEEDNILIKDRLCPIRENIPTATALAIQSKSRTESPRPSRKFDSVRNLLEKVRSTLLSSRSSKREGTSSSSKHLSRRSHWRKGDPSPPPPPMPSTDGEKDQSFSQSSPNTPLSKRKAKNKNKARNRSFSPVK